jgi:hypothetical protein
LHQKQPSKWLGLKPGIIFSMNEYHLTTGILGAGLAFTIFYLIRRDHLYLGDGIFWIMVAIAALIFGFSPTLIDKLAIWVGIAYPPTLLLIVSIAILLIKVLHADILSARMRRDIRRLNQEISMAKIEASTPREP